MANIIRKEEVSKITSIREYNLAEVNAFAAVGGKNVLDDLGVDIESHHLKEEENSQEVLQREIEAAIQKGYDEGFSQGLVEAKKTLADSINKVNNLVKEFIDLKSNMLVEAEEQVLKLALAIAQKVILEEPKQNPNMVRNIVKEAIKQLIDKEELVVKVHSNDVVSIKEIENQLFTTGVGAKVKIVADDYITAGGCIVESRSGSIDADLKTQCEEIKSNLLGNNTSSNEEPN